MKSSQITRATVTAATALIGIGLRVLVSFGAVSPLLFALNGYPLPNELQSAREILLDGNGFQVGRIDAGSNSTQVVELKTFRNWPNKQLIGNTVSHLGRSLASNTELTVGIFKAPEPEPAAGIGLRGNLFHESLKSVASGSSHGQSLPFAAACVMTGKYGYSA
jgi:hypothetical protein